MISPNAFPLPSSNLALVWELPEHVSKPVHGCRHETHHSLEWRVLSSAWMTARWHKHLCAAEAVRHGLGLPILGLERLFQRWQVFTFLRLDMLGEKSPDLFELRNVVWVLRTHSLKLLQMLLDLSHVNFCSIGRGAQLSPRDAPGDHGRPSPFPCRPCTFPWRGRRQVLHR